jgi:opacity protein-like surface antigen
MKIMSRRLLALASLTPLLFAAPVRSANAQSLTSVGIAAGASVPVSAYRDAVKTGYNAYLTLDVHAPLSPVSLRIDGMFNELDVKDNLINAQKSHVWAATANVVLGAADLIVAHPYIIGGVGYYRHSLTGQPVGFNIPAENKFGVNAGVGVSIPLTGFRAFAEARYHAMLDSDTKVRLIPISFGVVF